MGVKQLLKKNLPKPVVDFIKFLRSKKIIHTVSKISKRNNKYLQEINKIKNDKIRIVFVCQMTALWNSMRSVYEAACNDSSIESYIITLPEKTFDNENVYESNKAYDYIQSLNYENVIDGYDTKTKSFFDAKSLLPDYIFLPRPYEHYMPDNYKAKYLVKFTKICYINYGYNLTNWANTITYDINFLKNVYFTFADSTDSFDYIKQLYLKYKCEWNKVEYLGYPRFDLIQKKKEPKEKKVFLWTPRWTTNESLLGSNFFKYKNELFKFFIENKALKLIFRPHPLMIRNFLSTGEMTQQEVDELYKIFEENENFIFDKNDDYLKTFEKSDVLISDTSSIIAEYYYTNKPIIYCGITDDFINEAIEMSRTFIYAKKWTDVKNSILDFSKGNILNKRIEHESISIGSKIIDKIINDYKD